VLDALDPAEVGALYCEGDGAAWFTEQRGSLEECGGAWAKALQQRLAGGGRSLYVGAGIAELTAMLAEIEELGRTVVATNLRARECELLGRALAAAGVPPERLRIEAVDARAAAARGTFDHVAVVSVLTDPETWPVVSGVAYGRLPPVLLDIAAFEAERRSIRELVAAVCSALTLPGWVTTTVEEVSWFADWAEGRAVVEADDEILESALVGDPIGFLQLRTKPQEP
jgi:hypothetical protein